MSGGIVTLLIIVAIIWYTNYRENKQQEAEYESYCQSAQNEKKNEGSCNAESVEEAVPTATRSLVLNVLNRIGCEPTEEDEVNIRFTYQGENFLIEARDDIAFINILDLWWYQLSTYCDVEEFARLQKVINTANRDGTYTVLYTISKEAELIGVHTKKNLIFVPHIPYIEQYLTNMLEGFFRVQRYVLTEMEKIKVAEEQ